MTRHILGQFLDSLRDRRSKAYIRTQFVILYGTLFAFLIAIIAGMSYKMIGTMEVETAEKGKILVEQTRDLIDVHLTQIDRMLTRFERSPVFRAFLIMPSYRKSSPELSIVIDAFNELKEYRLQNDFIRSVYLFSSKNGIVISSESIYLDFPAEYQFTLDYGHYRYPEFEERFLKEGARMKFAPADTIIADQDKISAVLCINSLPIGSRDPDFGFVLAALDGDRLNELLSGLYGAEYGGAFILDHDHNILSAVGSAKAREAALKMGLLDQDAQQKIQLGGEEWLVSIAHSKKFGFSLISATPRSVYAARLRTLVHFSIAIGVFFSIIGALFVFFLVLRNTKPLLDIADYAGLSRQNDNSTNLIPDTKGQNDIVQKDFLGRIKEGISRLSNEKEHLQDLLERRKPLLRQSIVRDLLEENYSDPQEVADLLADAGIKLRGDEGFAVSIASITSSLQEDFLQNPYSATRFALLNIEEAVELKWDNRAFSCSIGPKSIAILFLLESQDYDSFLRDLELFHYDLKEIYHIDIMLSCGNYASTLNEVPLSYRTAKRLLDYIEDHPAGKHMFVNSRCIPVLPAPQIYSIEIESRIIAEVRTGNIQVLDKTIQELLKNAKKADLAKGYNRPLAYHTLIHGLELTLQRLEHMDIIINEPNYQEMDDEQRLNFLLDKIKDIAIKKKAANSSDEIDLSERLEDYIKGRFSNPNLTLYMVAKDFGKKETWMYDYCKNQFGETFSSKLQSFRLSKAKELLAQTELSIEEISIQIGYGNSHSFRRAFKRVFGITPAEYREFIGKENKE